MSSMGGPRRGGRFQALLEASEIRPSALNASQRIVVMEVKNLTCDPQQAGADLRTDLHEHLAPPPQRVRLNEAAASHSHALVRQPPGPRTAPSPGRPLRAYRMGGVASARGAAAARWVPLHVACLPGLPRASARAQAGRRQQRPCTRG